MKLRFLALAALLAAFTVPAAMADTDYTLTVTTYNYAPASGTLTLDEVSPTTVKFDGLSLGFSYGNESLAAMMSGGGFFNLLNFGTSGAELQLGSGANFIAFIANSGFPSQFQLGGDFAAQAAAMPEDSSIAMMGMAGVGLLGAFKRKFFTR